MWSWRFLYIVLLGGLIQSLWAADEIRLHFEPEEARLALDPAQGNLEPFLVPKIILETLQSNSSLPSPTRERLEAQFKKAASFFQKQEDPALVFDVLPGLWASKTLPPLLARPEVEKLKDLSKLSLAEKAYLIHAYTFLQWAWLRSSQEASDRELVRKIEMYLSERSDRLISFLQFDLKLRSDAEAQARAFLKTLIEAPPEQVSELKKTKFDAYKGRSLLGLQKEMDWVIEVATRTHEFKTEDLSLERLALLKILQRLSLSHEEPPPYHWTEDDLRAIQEIAERSTGELSEASIESILKQSKRYQLAQIAARSKTSRLLIDDKDTSWVPLNTDARLAGVSAIAALSLYASLRQMKKAESKIVLGRPRLAEDLERAVLRNFPRLDLRGDSVAGRFQDALFRTQEFLEGLDRIPTTTSPYPLQFNEAFREARELQLQNRAFLNAFRGMMLENLGPDVFQQKWPLIESKLQDLLRLESERVLRLSELVQSTLLEASGGGQSLQKIHQKMRRELQLREGLAALESDYEKARKGLIREIVRIPTRAERVEGIEATNHRYQILGTFRRIFGPIWHPIKEKRFLSRASLSSKKDGDHVNMKNPMDSLGTWGSEMLPGESLSQREIQTNCRRSLARFSMQAALLASMGGLGYALHRLNQRPLDPEDILKASNSQITSFDASDAGIYIDPMRAQFQGAIEHVRSGYMKPLRDANGIDRVEWVSAKQGLNDERKQRDLPTVELILSEDSMSTPSQESGLGSVAYALVKVKEASSSISLDERLRNASNGVLIRFKLTHTESNLMMARRLGMKGEDVPQKVFWKFDGLRVLEGDALSRSLVHFTESSDSGERNLKLDLEVAKALFLEP